MIEDSSKETAPYNRGIVLLVAAVQFVNILDFMMVNPLGPQFSKHLLFGEDKLPWVMGSYTASACISGLLGALFLDRFDRKKALLVVMLGLAVGTLLGAYATSFATLVAARILAGAFGGPATSIAMSIVTDVVPDSHRGRAMGTVMTAFALASVIGVPTGLYLTELGSWRTPFFGVTFLSLLAMAAAAKVLPPMTGHLWKPGEPSSGTSMDGIRSLLRKPLVRLSCLLSALTMISMFSLVPNIPAHLNLNLHVPTKDFKILYMVGGLGSVLVVPTVGRLVDRFGSFFVGTFGTLLMATVTSTFVFKFFWTLPVWPGFLGFMMSGGIRNVSFNALTSKVPDRKERAQFQSLQSAVTHGASAAGAGISTLMLTKVARAPLPGEPIEHAFSLEGIQMVALWTISIALVGPFLLRAIEKRVRAQQEPEGAPAG